LLDLMNELAEHKGAPLTSRLVFEKYLENAQAGKFEGELRSSAIYWHLMILALHMLELKTH